MHARPLPHEAKLSDTFRFEESIQTDLILTRHKMFLTFTQGTADTINEFRIFRPIMFKNFNEF